MLEESIDSSPHSHSSTHNSRLLRKGNYKTVQENSSGELKNLLLEALYHNSCEEDSLESFSSAHKKGPTIVKDFKPFEAEMCLVLADRCSTLSQSKLTTPAFHVEGFVPCEELLKNDSKTETNNQCDLKHKEQIDMCDITDTELINCCEKVETLLKVNTQIPKPEIPHGSKSVVEAILNDFCSSPYNSPTPSPERRLKYLERTPLFKLLHKPTRFYSRRSKKTAKGKLEEQFQTHRGDDVDRVHHDNISLSPSPILIQEDAMPDKENFEEFIPNTSQTLCDNLIHLSNYFTQNSQPVQNNEELKNDNDLFISEFVPKLLDQVISLRKQHPPILAKDSCSYEEFKGFSETPKCNNNISGWLNITNDLDDTLIEPDILKLSEEIFQNLSPHVSDEESEQMPPSLPKDIENSDILPKKDWFDDDDDFFASFTTQDVLWNKAKANTNRCDIEEFKKLNNTQHDELLPNLYGYRTANGKQVCISEESIKRVEDLIKDFRTSATLPDIENDLKSIKNKCLIRKANAKCIKSINETENREITQNTSKIRNEVQKTTFEGFKTARGTKIVVSEEAKKSVAHLLKECEIENYDYANDLLELKNKRIQPHTNKSNCVKDAPNKGSESSQPLLLQVMSKRKHSIDNKAISSSSPSPSDHTPLHKSKTTSQTSLRSTLDECKEQQQQQQLTAQSKRLITLKNVLSLKKNKRKQKILPRNCEIDTNSSPVKNVECKTPVKMQAKQKQQQQLFKSTKTPATPNMQEFFSQAGQTSTPYVSDEVKQPQPQPADEVDSGLKLIPWDSNNDSSTTKTNSITDSNITPQTTNLTKLISNGRPYGLKRPRNSRLKNTF